MKRLVVSYARLSVNVISKGKYWKAGEEIPDEELSPNLLKYVAGDNGYAEEIRQQRSDAMALNGNHRLSFPRETM